MSDDRYVTKSGRTVTRSLKARENVETVRDRPDLAWLPSMYPNVLNHEPPHPQASMNSRTPNVDCVDDLEPRPGTPRRADNLVEAPLDGAIAGTSRVENSDCVARSYASSLCKVKSKGQMSKVKSEGRKSSKAEFDLAKKRLEIEHKRKLLDLEKSMLNCRVSCGSESMSQLSHCEKPNELLDQESITAQEKTRIWLENQDVRREPEIPRHTDDAYIDWIDAIGSLE